MDPAVRFWLLILAAVGTIAAGVLLVVSAFLPGTIFSEMDTPSYIVAIFGALISLGVFVWALTAESDTEDPVTQAR